MVTIRKNISELLCDITSKLKTVLSPSTLQVGSLNLTRKTNALDMLSPYIRPVVEAKYRILNHDLLSINPKEAKKIKKLVHKYYNKTIALPFTRIEIKIIAHEIALHLKLLQHKEGKATALKDAAAIANQFGVSKPTKISAKLFRPNFWRKSISNPARKQEENLAVELKLFNDSYCSAAAKERHAEELAAKAAYISTLMNSNEASKKKAHAIEAKRYHHQALTTAKARGLTNLKHRLGLHAIMLTLTCPPEVRKDSNIEGCIEYLSRFQNKLSSFRSNHSLGLAGLTSIEPHKRGYPHLHTYAVGTKSDLVKLIRCAEEITKSFSNSSRNRSLNIKWEDNSISSLAFYVAKSTLHPSFELDAWYSTHQQRRLNYFGLPADEVWNALRSKPLFSNTKCKKKLHAAQLAAKDGDYATFCQLVGGLALRRKERPYKVLYLKYLNQFNDVTKRKMGIIIFRTFIPNKYILHAIANIVKTKFPRSISFLKSALKYYDTVGLRAPPHIKKTPLNIINIKEQIKRLKL